MELMLALFNIVQGTISSIMTAAGFGSPQQTTLPVEMITTIEDCGFFESIPLWAVTLIGGLFITVLLVHNDNDRLRSLLQYVYGDGSDTAIDLCGRTDAECWQKLSESYCAVLLEGAIIVLACIIFSLLRQVRR